VLVSLHCLRVPEQIIFNIAVPIDLRLSLSSTMLPVIVLDFIRIVDVYSTESRVNFLQSPAPTYMERTATQHHLCTVFRQRRRRRRGRQGARAPPKKKIGKIFFGQLLCKILAFLAFSGKYHVKFGNLVNFSDKHHTKLGHFDNFSGKYHVEFGNFVNFSYIIFGQNVLPPKVD